MPKMSTSLAMFAFFFLLTKGASLDICPWCEAGDVTCDWEYADFIQDVFPLSVTSQLDGRAMPYWRPASQPQLQLGNARATLAIVVHHGAGRNGENYTSYMANAVINAGLSLDNVVVIGPQVYCAGDQGLDESLHIWWDTMEDDNVDPDGGVRDWKWGGNSTSDLPVSTSSFDYLDEMMKTLGDRTLYPNLERIVYAGHSSGGQMMQRYALFSRVGATEVGLPVTYFVANPSSVTYLGPERPVEAATKDCDFCVNTTIADQVWSFATPSDSDCAATYDSYGYGLQDLVVDYAMATGTATAIGQYEQRDVVYLAGESDVCDTVFMSEHRCDAESMCIPEDGGLDTSCEAETQGWCRMSRLNAFAQYVRYFYDDAELHELISIPYVGHSGCGIFQSSEFRSAALVSSRVSK